MWRSARVRLPQAGGERPLRLTQGPQRACVRSSLGPSLCHHTPSGTPRTTHISLRTGVFVCLHLHAPPQYVDPRPAALTASEAILGPLVGGLCKILQVNFGEFTFHAVSILEGGCGRRLGAA